MQVEGERSTSVEPTTGVRVSNAYEILLQQENSPRKLGLMLHKVIITPVIITKAEAVEDGHAYH